MCRDVRVWCWGGSWKRWECAASLYRMFHVTGTVRVMVIWMSFKTLEVLVLDPKSWKHTNKGLRGKRLIRSACSSYIHVNLQPNLLSPSPTNVPKISRMAPKEISSRGRSDRRRWSSRSHLSSCPHQSCWYIVQLHGVAEHSSYTLFWLWPWRFNGIHSWNWISGLAFL